MELRRQYDAAIVGAGPAGTVAAIALAQRGARVLLLEATPKAATRFAGEWLHPPAVEVLQRLGLGTLEEALHHPTGQGFVVFPDDGGEPIQLPYADGGVGLSCEHRDLVQALRQRAADMAEIDYAPGVRATQISGHQLVCQPRRGGASQTVTAGRIVGADGRSSMVRQHLGIPDRSTHLSHMAGVELTDVELPFEGYGHVMVGSPGPILMYRIGPSRIRMCLDVPADARRDSAALWDGFAPMLPESLREPFRQALAQRRLTWAANGFRPRACYGRGHVALLGDAIGHFHPFTASGITLGILDAARLAQVDDVATYRRERESESYVPELLANALYQVFSRQDRSAVAIRHAVYHRWRNHAQDRKRTMRILSGDATDGLHFGSSFVRMAAEAIGRTTVQGASKGQWKTLAQDLGSFAEWTQWPVASLLPAMVRRNQRPWSRPDRALAAGAGTGADGGAAEQAQPRQTRRAEADMGVSATEWLEEARSELEQATPNSDSGPLPWARWLQARAELAACLDESLPDRSGLGQALEGFRPPSTLETHELATVVHVAAEWRVAAGEALSVWVETLLAREQQDGQFGSVNETGVARRALTAVRQRYPGMLQRSLDAALHRSARWLRGRQGADGSWHDGDATLATARALQALAADLERPVEADLHRGMRWLVQEQGEDGTWADTQTTAVALAALAEGRAGPWSSLERAAAALMERPPRLEGEAHLAGALPSQVTALAQFERRRQQRPGARRGHPEPKHDPEADWAYCKQSLLEVSRTFARPIEMLQGDLEVAVSCGYLLCRAVDTVEDHASLPMAHREQLYRAFVDAVEGRDGPETFAKLYRDVEGQGPDHDLCRNFPRVVRVFRRLPARLQRGITPWVTEMARGMELYSHRTSNESGITALHTLEDLQRYCYYVAGTVGHMLTELFVAEMQDGSPERARNMRENAESFGLALQLVNILKDVTDDRERGVSFIPRTLCEAQGISVEQLLQPEHRAEAHGAVRPIFEVAERMLDRALTYTLAIPPSEQGMRLFCLLPLWMAVRTLVIAKGNDGMFIADRPVKITRDEVERLIADCVQHCSQDDALRSHYAALWSPMALTQALGEAESSQQELH